MHIAQGFKVFGQGCFLLWYSVNTLFSTMGVKHRKNTNTKARQRAHYSGEREARELEPPVLPLLGPAQPLWAVGRGLQHPVRSEFLYTSMRIYGLPLFIDFLAFLIVFQLSLLVQTGLQLWRRLLCYRHIIFVQQCSLGINVLQCPRKYLCSHQHK